MFVKTSGTGKSEVSQEEPVQILGVCIYFVDLKLELYFSINKLMIISIAVS